MEKTRTPLTEEQKDRRRVGRMIGRTLWLQDFRGQNPDATREQVKAAWTLEVSKAQRGIGLKTLRTLEKAGFALVKQAPKPRTAKPAA